MPTIIHHIGHWRAGGTLSGLLQLLDEEPLDREFEHLMGYSPPPCLDLRGRDIDGIPGGWHFHGNFYRLSCCFRLTTNELPVAAQLRAAIDRNRERADYRAQPKPTRHTFWGDPIRSRTQRQQEAA